MTGKELIKKLQRDGRKLDRITGSHHVMEKNSATISVPVHGNRDLPAGTLAAILKAAKINRR